MPRSIKVHTGYVNTIRTAVKRNGFQTQRALAERAGYSLATVKKFLGGKPVDFATFTELCETLNVDWESVADLGNHEADRPSGVMASTSQTTAAEPSQLPNQPVEQLAQAQKVGAQDWGAAVDVSTFYGREQALATLESWIVGDSPEETLRQRTRLVALYGIGGIGKTTLTAKLAHTIAHQFDYLIWRTLKNAPPVQETLKNLLNFFLEQPNVSLSSNEVAETLDAQLRQLINCARNHRCLIVLDNIEPLFEEGDRAGTYRTGYEGYGDLFKVIGEADHNSCFIITSRELPKEITLQAGESLPTRCFQLSGLTETNGQQLINANGQLTGTSSEWQQLVQAYSGNPLALKMIAAAVRDYFDGDISSFLALSQEDSLIFGDIRQLLVRQIRRLTPIEKDIMYWLAINREPVAWQTLQTDIVGAVPLNKVLQAIDSLERRSLIERNRSTITQQAVIMDYFTGELIHQISHEISHPISEQSTSEQPNFLWRYALVKASARDYIRQAQIRLILSPIIKQLQDSFASSQTLSAALSERLNNARQQPKKDGYVGGNVLTLLRHLKVDFTGQDFSDLAIWQAYLQGINLHDVNFSGSDLSRSVFNQPFGSIRTMSFSADGNMLATGDTNSEIWLWQTSFSPTAGHIKSHISTFQGHQNWVCSVAFSPDGNYLTSGSEDRTMRLWNAASGQCLQSLQGSSNWVWSVAFSPDGKTLASGQGDRLVHLWDTAPNDLSSSQPLKTLAGAQNAIWSVVFSPNGKQLASGNEDGNIHLWTLSENPTYRSLSGHAKSVWSVAFDLKGENLASGSADQSIKLWNRQTGRCQQTLLGHKHWVCSVAFHPQQNLLASGSYDRTLKLWDLDSGECTATWKGHTSGLWCIAFSPAGDFLASGSIDQTIRLWDTRTGDCQQVLKAHENWVMAVAVSPDGQWVASGSADRTVRLWNAASGELVHTLAGHSNSVWSVTFSPDGRYLASGSDDKTIRLWEVETGACVKTLKNKEPYEGMTITNITGLTESEISTLEQLGAIRDA